MAGSRISIQELGQYRLLKKLGEGAMGAVFLAEDKMVGRKVALKVLPKALAENSEFLIRFKREAQAAGRINHVNIVGAYAIDEDKGHHFYVMEFCEGESLDKVLAREKILPVPQALDYIEQSARGLQHAHDMKIVHRDIKPANIFLTQDGITKILDLGLAKNFSDPEAANMTQAGQAVGTPHYISPEQARGESEIDGRADIYSLGATFYHLVTGQTPFNGPTSAVIMSLHLTQELPDPRELRQGLPEGVALVIKKMMAKKADERYQDCNELISDLERVKAGQVPLIARTKGRRRTAEMGHTTGPQDAVRSGIRGRREGATGKTQPVSPVGMYMGLGLGALILLGIGAFLVFGGKKPPEIPVAENKKPPVPVVNKGETGAPPEAPKHDQPASKDPKDNKEPKEPAVTKPVQKDPDAVTPPPPAPNMADPRETFARRQLDDLIKQEAANEVSDFGFRGRLEHLATSYSKTTAGKEAAEKLKTLPALPTGDAPSDPNNLVANGSFERPTPGSEQADKWLTNESGKTRVMGKGDQHWLRLEAGARVTQSFQLPPSLHWAKVSVRWRMKGLQFGTEAFAYPKISMHWLKMPPPGAKDADGDPLEPKSWFAEAPVIMENSDWITVAWASPRRPEADYAKISIENWAAAGTMDVDDLTVTPVTPEEATKIRVATRNQLFTTDLDGGKFLPGKFDDWSTGRPKGWLANAFAEKGSDDSKTWVKFNNPKPATSSTLFSYLRLQPEWQDISVKYRVRTANLRSYEGENSTPEMRFTFQDANGENLSPVHYFKLKQEVPDWKEEAHSFKIPPKAVSLEIMPNLYYCAGTFEFGDLSIEPSANGAVAVSKTPSVAPEKVALPVSTERIAIPDVEKQKDVEKQVRELFKVEYGKVSAADRQALAEKLLELAPSIQKTDLLQYYVLLREARDLSIQAGQPDLLIKALDGINGSFKVADPQQEKLAFLQKIESYLKTPESLRTWGDAGLILANEAMAADDYEKAARYASITENASRKLQDATMLTAAQTKAKEARDLQGPYLRVKPFRETLDKNPADPEANFQVGRYLCYYKNDWAHGLPLLAKGSDTRMKSAAEKDLADPTKPEDLAALGDAWLDNAQRESGNVKLNLAIRALENYGKAQVDASDALKVKLEEKMKSASAAIGSTGGGMLMPGNVAAASTGSTCKGSSTAAELIDGITTGYTGSTGFAMGSYPVDFIITMPRTYLLRQIRLLLWDGADRYYRYAVDVSMDNKTWTTVADHTKGRWKSWQTLDLPPTLAKFIRLRGTYNSSNGGFHCVELEAYCIPPAVPAKPKFPSDP